MKRRPSEGAWWECQQVVDGLEHGRAEVGVVERSHTQNLDQDQSVWYWSA